MVQVLINDCPVSFKLEQERDISDVVNSISEWSRERDLVFYELYIDEDLYSIDRMPDVDVRDIKVINCIVQSKADIVFSSIDEAARYCDRASDFIKRVLVSGGCTRHDIDDLAVGTAWLLDVMSKTVNLLNLGNSPIRYKDHDISHYVRAAEEFRDSLRGIEDLNLVLDYLSAHKDLFLNMKYIFKMFLLSDSMRSLIVQSIDSPDVLISALVKTKEELAPQLENIQAAAIAYQTGKDLEGSERLKSFVDFVFRYIRSCYQVVPVFRVDLSDVKAEGSTLEQFNRDLQSLLHEMISVMENNDIISLSDILEYEITPALKNLTAYIDVLMGEISNK